MHLTVNTFSKISFFPHKPANMHLKISLCDLPNILSTICLTMFSIPYKHNGLITEFYLKLVQMHIILEHILIYF